MLDMTMGINRQALAVANYLSAHDGLEVSWDSEAKRHQAEIQVSPYYNGRERGLCFSVSNISGPALNVVCYEHRNSDNICLVWWKSDQRPFNPITRNEDIPENLMKDKWDVGESFPCGQAMQAADKIYDLMTDFWSQVAI